MRSVSQFVRSLDRQRVCDRPDRFAFRDVLVFRMARFALLHHDRDDRCGAEKSLAVLLDDFVDRRFAAEDFLDGVLLEVICRDVARFERVAGASISRTS